VTNDATRVNATDVIKLTWGTKMRNCVPNSHIVKIHDCGGRHIEFQEISGIMKTFALNFVGRWTT